MSRRDWRWPHTTRTPRLTPKDKDHREEHCRDCEPEGGQRRRGEGTQERVDSSACSPRPFFGSHRRPAVGHDPHARPQKPQKGRQHREPEDETDHIPGEGDPSAGGLRPEPLLAQPLDLLCIHSASAKPLSGFFTGILNRQLCARRPVLSSPEPESSKIFHGNEKCNPVSFAGNPPDASYRDFRRTLHTENETAGLPRAEDVSRAKYVTTIL